MSSVSSGGTGEDMLGGQVMPKCRQRAKPKNSNRHHLLYWEKQLKKVMEVKEVPREHRRWGGGSVK